jgi:type VI secretion system protein ImpM
VIHVGFDGKLPSRGDFIGAGLPRSFLAPWRNWIDGALQASRRALGERWLPAWMEAPVWRFALPAPACGPDAVLGLMLPSVDRAGRHYPLTVAAVFAGQRQAPACHAWLDSVEALALDALAHDRAPDALAAALAAVAKPAGTDAAGWWTAGSPRVAAAHMPRMTLPAVTAFAAMIDSPG